MKDIKVFATLIDETSKKQIEEISQSEAFNKLELAEFEEDMKGIESSSVVLSALDESPRAYKPINTILDNIKDTVVVLGIIKPIYNFKAKQND